MAFWILPNIEYSVTREFQSRLFNRLTYTAAFLSLAALTVINGMFGLELNDNPPG